MNLQEAVLDCFARAHEISTTNLMRFLRQRFRAMISLQAIQEVCEELVRLGRLAVRIKGKGRYYSILSESAVAS